MGRSPNKLVAVTVLAGMTLTTPAAARQITPPPTSSLQVAAAGPTDEARAVRAAEVRTVWTRDLGVRHPLGLAYDRRRGEFLVTGANGHHTVLLRIDRRGDRVALVAGGIPSGALLTDVTAVNPIDELQYTFDAASTEVVGRSGDGTVMARFDLSGIDLVEVVGLVFAPTSDSTDEPDAVNLFVADSGPAGGSGSIVEVSLAPIVTATAQTVSGQLLRTVATSGWIPGSPDPSGVVHLQSRDQLLVVDSEVDEVTGAGWHDVNVWRSSRTGQQAAVGTLWGATAARFAGKAGFSREPTGAGYDPFTDTLFVSDDSARKVFVIRPGLDGAFATADDVVTAIDALTFGSDDTEDPEFDVVTGHLFILDGVGMEIFRVNPVDGVFGNGNDTVTHFDISHLGPKDFEGLTSDPARDTLYVGARTTKQIFEITKTGGLVRTISVADVPGLRFVSGLGLAPASDGSGRASIWIVDRAIDNGADPTENDGRMYEVALDAPVTPPTGAPTAVNDSASTSEDTPVIIPVLANDTDPNGDPLTVQLASSPANGTAAVLADQTVRYTPAPHFHGTDTFTYRASDGTTTSDLATVTMTVAPVNDAPVAADDTATTPQGAAVVVPVLANDIDVDGDPLTITALTAPSTGSVTIVTGGVRYEPGPTFTGTITFTYRASDGTATSDVATVTITVRTPETSEYLAVSQTSVHGTVTGALSATHADDGIVQSLLEASQAGGKRSRLEHRWTFQVTTPGTTAVVVRGWTDGEPFDLAWSVDGSTFAPLTRISSLTETGATVALPAGLAGTVIIRATDGVSASKGDGFRDTLTIDQLVIRTVS